MKTPIIFLIFNRPTQTQVVFESIKRVKPERLLIVADAPRISHPDDKEKCLQARRIAESVDWDCKVLTNYAEVNLGCKKRVSSGLDWAFQIVESAIILEDDCLANESFFDFCEELLDRFADDARVMVISGNNFQDFPPRNSDSYYFSRYNHCWGWATWRRAWEHFDVNMTEWERIRSEGWLYEYFDNNDDAQTWERIFNECYEEKNNSWAYIWTYSSWLQSGLTVIPRCNLVSNIGYSDDATHTTKKSRFSDMNTENLDFPLIHPKFMIRNKSADDFVQKNNFSTPSLLKRIIRKILNNR